MPDISKTRRVGLVVLLALAAACSTPAYGPLGPKAQLGYRDMPNADGSHTVLVVAISEADARTWWERRAQEVCAGAGVASRNIFRAQVPVETYSGYAASPYPGGIGGSYTSSRRGAFNIEGYVRCVAPTAPASPAPP